MAEITPGVSPYSISEPISTDDYEYSVLEGQRHIHEAITHYRRLAENVSDGGLPLLPRHRITVSIPKTWLTRERRLFHFSIPDLTPIPSLRRKKREQLLSDQWTLDHLSCELSSGVTSDAFIQHNHSVISETLRSRDPVEYLSASEIRAIRTENSRFLRRLPAHDLDARETYFEAARFSERDRLTIGERSVRSLSEMTKWEIGKESVALVGGVIGGYIATQVFGEIPLGLTYLTGNIPSWVALGGLAAAGVYMTEKRGYCANLGATLAHASMRFAKKEYRMLATAAPIVGWDLLKDGVYNASVLGDLLPQMHAVVPPSFFAWNFVVNGALLTLGHVAQSAWSIREGRKSHSS